MCTVTFIPMKTSRGPGLRVVCNRDEQRDRPDASPPAWREAAPGVRAVWPMDTLACGTWIAAAAHGLVLCLLNGNPEPKPALPPAEELLSRGGLIPSLIAAADAERAMEDLSGLALDRYAPFRLVAAGLGHDGSPRVFDSAWDARRLVTTRHGPGPACFVSSGLGDSKVAARLGLFDAMVRPLCADPAQDAAHAQDRYHTHAWPGRPEISVMMSRAAARTVSVTTVRMVRVGGGHEVEMGYRTVPDACVLDACQEGVGRSGAFAAAG